MPIEQLELTDEVLIRQGLPEPKAAWREKVQESYRFDGHTQASAKRDILAFAVPEESRRLANETFADLASKLRAETALALYYHQSEGKRLNPNRLVDAYFGAEDVWIDTRRTEGQARRVSIVIDAEADGSRPPEVLQSRCIYALALALALEASGVEVEVLSAWFVHPKKLVHSHHGSRYWLDDDQKAVEVTYYCKRFEGPLQITRFGLFQDTGTKRLANACIGGQRWSTQKVFCTKPTWLEVASLVEGSDSVIWVGDYLEGVPSDQEDRVNQCYVNNHRQVVRAAKELTEILTDKEGREERLAKEAAESLARYEAYLRELALRPPAPAEAPGKPARKEKVYLYKPPVERGE